MCEDGYACTADACDPTKGCVKDVVAGCGSVEAPVLSKFTCADKSFANWQLGDPPTVPKAGELAWRVVGTKALGNATWPCALHAGGEVDLTAGLSRAIRKEHYTNTSPPLVWGNLVILGNGVGDRLQYKGDPPGDIQAFNVKTGKRVWRFKTVPEAGEYGNDTWKDDSWKYVGHTNAWAPLSADDARGIIYVPVGTPSNDWYGGERKGAGLFGETVLALDAKTGKRIWHFQTAHHGLWDYDPPTAPVIATVTVAGKRRDIVMQATKQGFLFVFDRVTGTPIWPIEERPVPQSNVPGEETSATQPFPTKPAPFSPQGFTTDDVTDFTPEIKAAAMETIKGLRLGPLFTPPSLEGTVVRPGVIGGAGWGGVAVDRETGWAYVKASHNPELMAIAARSDKSDTVDAPYVLDGTRRSLAVRMPPARRAFHRRRPLQVIHISHWRKGWCIFCTAVVLLFL